MANQHPVIRHYPLSAIDFRDFWDICRHFHQQHPDLDFVCYSIESSAGVLVRDEIDLALILEAIAGQSDTRMTYIARLFATDADDGDNESEPAAAEVRYQCFATADRQPGLHIRSDSLNKLGLYYFESQLYGEYTLKPVMPAPSIQFGKPCELLAAVVDLRGFSNFCEQPQIESPYTGGLMTAFYHLIEHAFTLYAPGLIKFQGDGVLAIWETSPEDRSVAIDIALRGIRQINAQWREVRRSPAFIHGAPEGIGAGISHGLGSMIHAGQHDYIGRPINVASRLCSVCSGGEILVDHTLPHLPEDWDREDTSVHIRSYGRHAVWRLNLV